MRVDHGKVGGSHGDIGVGNNEEPARIAEEEY